MSNGECLCGYKRRNSEETNKRITANAKEIAEDFSKIGATKTCRKWQISTASLYRISEVREQMVKPRLKMAREGLPALPCFSNDWPSEVQLRWLDIWERMEVGNG